MSGERDDHVGLQLLAPRRQLLQLPQWRAAHPRHRESMHDPHLALELTAQVAPTEALDARTEFVAGLQLSIDEDLRRGVGETLAAIRVRHHSLGEAIGVHVAVEDAADRLPPTLLRLWRRRIGLVQGEPQHELACARIRANEPMLQRMLERQHRRIRVAITAALAMVLNQFHRHAHDPIESWCGGDRGGGSRRDLNAIHVHRRRDGVRGRLCCGDSLGRRCGGCSGCRRSVR
eukprot:6723440-Prymnesium_polylepis.1